MRLIEVLIICFAQFFLFYGCTLNPIEQLPEESQVQYDTESCTIQTDSEYYTLADFADVVLGETTYDELIKLVSRPEGLNGAFAMHHGMGIYYPASENSDITVVVNNDFIVIEIFLSEAYDVVPAETTSHQQNQEGA